jgi:hypothetical protein
VSHRGWQVDRGGEPQPQVRKAEQVRSDVRLNFIFSTVWAKAPTAGQVLSVVNRDPTDEKSGALGPRHRHYILNPGPPSSQLVDQGAIVTTSLIPDPQILNLWTQVNGVTMQNDTTANMIFGVAHLISFFSMGITLLPGDVIFTGNILLIQLSWTLIFPHLQGTPKGVNLGRYGSGEYRCH